MEDEEEEGVISVTVIGGGRSMEELKISVLGRTPSLLSSADIDDDFVISLGYVSGEVDLNFLLPKSHMNQYGDTFQ